MIRDLKHQFKIRLTSGITTVWQHKYVGYAKAVKQTAGLDHYANVERALHISAHPIEELGDRIRV